MKVIKILILGILCLHSIQTMAQKDSEAELVQAEKPMPLDDIVERRVSKSRRALKAAPIRENEIMWEKRIWRIIDVREKINKPFAYPKQPFISILLDAVKDKELMAYELDDFKTRLSQEDVWAQIAGIDSVDVWDFDLNRSVVKTVPNDINPEDIKRYRIKELWYFDTNQSKLRVKILGIAPLREIFGDNGEFRYEQPMFWLYFPEAREHLAKHQAFNPLNQTNVMSWADIFDMRFFSSYIMKDGNVHDRKLEHFLSGTDLLLESRKIQDEIFNFEHDLWEQ